MTDQYRKHCDQYPDPPDPPKPWGEPGWQRRLKYVAAGLVLLGLFCVVGVFYPPFIGLGILIILGVGVLLVFAKATFRYVKLGDWWPFDNFPPTKIDERRS